MPELVLRDGGTALASNPDLGNRALPLGRRHEQLSQLVKEVFVGRMSGRHVGTRMMLQVPSSRGVGWRAPFLHNGCAPTLADRFGSSGGCDKRGHTSGLAPGDISGGPRDVVGFGAGAWRVTLRRARAYFQA